MRVVTVSRCCTCGSGELLCWCGGCDGERGVMLVCAVAYDGVLGLFLYTCILLCFVFWGTGQ